MPLKMRAACDQTRVSSALLLGSYPKVSPRTSRLDSSLSILWPGSHAKPPVIDQVSRRRWQTGWRVLLNVLNTPAVAPETNRRSFGSNRQLLATFWRNQDREQVQLQVQSRSKLLQFRNESFGHIQQTGIAPRRCPRLRLRPRPRLWLWRRP